MTSRARERGKSVTLRGKSRTNLQIFGALPMLLSLTDSQLTAVMDAAVPIPRHRRDDFLRAVATALRGHELGDGVVGCAIRSVQREFYDLPLDGSHHSGK